MTFRILSKNYQLAVQEAKLRLDLAIAPGLWLMPSNMIINTESVVGYNNKLMKATNDMKFGVNNSLNTESKPVGISHNLGSTKLKLPHSIVETNPKLKIPPTQNEKSTKGQDVTTQHETNPQSEHEVRILTFIIISGGLAWYLFR